MHGDTINESRERAVSLGREYCVYAVALIGHRLSELLIAKMSIVV